MQHLKRDKDEKNDEINPNTNLSDLIDDRVMNFFRLLNFEKQFENVLKLDPAYWHLSTDYIFIKNIVDNLNVTNDTSERGCALAKKYNNPIIKDNNNKTLFHNVINDTNQRPNATRKDYM